MTKRAKRRVVSSVVLLVAISIFASIMINEKASASWSGAKVEQDNAQVAEQTTEQKFKNIQVLKGLPAAQLRPMMNYMSASLGVTCAACHVKTGDEWEFDKDDKKNKQTARKMIQMTLDLNKNQFEGKVEITCYTCHQGLGHPASVPPLPRAMQREQARPTQAFPTPQQILAQYTQAIGGKEAVEKAKTRLLKGVSVAANGQSFPLEIQFESADKVALHVELGQTPTTQKLNGSAGWLKSSRDDRAMDSVEILKIKSLAWSLEPLQLKEPYPRLTFGGWEKVGDRDCNILRMALPDKRRVRFYFDKETGLLLRRVIQTDTPIGTDPEQIDYEDYRDVDGVKVAFTIKTSYLDTNYSSLRKFTEIKHGVKIESSIFNK